MTVSLNYATILPPILLTALLFVPTPDPYAELNAALSRMNIRDSWEEVATTTPVITTPPIIEKPKQLARIDPYLANNCLAFARTRVKGLPSGLLDAKYLDSFPNTPPQVGGIVLQKFLQDDGTWLFHVSVILELREKGLWVIESNYKKGKITNRLIAWDDSHIVQFWHA